MQVQKIDNNKLEILINLDDLKNNNISLENFMSISLENQSFLLEILKYASKSTNFRLNNCSFKVDTFAILSKKQFILIITRLPKIIKTSKKFKNNTNLIAKFKSFDNLCGFCTLINTNTNSSLYYFKNCYYLKIKLRKIHNLNKIIFNLKEFADSIMPSNFINENENLIIEKNAIEICKEFV